MSNLKKLGIIISLIFIIGVIGYHYLLGTSLIDSLYMTVITVSTVGFKEVGEMNDASKIFTILLIISSLSFLAYAISGAVSMVMEGNLGKIIRRKKLNSKLNNLKDHYIICGAEETGEHAINMFIKSRENFIVIDEDEEIIDDLLKKNIMAIRADSSSENALNFARIKHAKGILLSLKKDIDNVFTALTARYLNPEINIVSTVKNIETEKKLIRAGVNNTINPNNIGGNRMATMLLKPNVISFFDVITRIGEYQLNVEEVKIETGSDLDGKSLTEAEIPKKTGLKILAIKKHDSDEIKLNPDSKYILKNGDIMIVIGSEEQIEKLKRLSV